MRKRTRTQRGAHLAEFAAAIFFGVPLLVCLVFIALECAHFYTIKSAMEMGARNGARGLVTTYNRSKTQKTSVDWITMPNYIASSKQFTVVWDASSPPKYVTVTCAYPSDGSLGLPQFPAGPLSFLKDTFSMGTTSVKGTFTWPVQ